MTQAKTWRVDFPGFKWNGCFQGHGTLIVCDSGAVMACTDFGNYCYHFHQKDFTPQQLLSMIRLKKPKTYNEYLLNKFCWHLQKYDSKATLAHIRWHIRESSMSREEKQEELELLKTCSLLETEKDFDDWCNETQYFCDTYEYKQEKFTSQHYAFVIEFLPKALRQMIREEHKKDCCGIYFCPSAKQLECPTHGGFDKCCNNPEQHKNIEEMEKILG